MAEKILNYLARSKGLEIKQFSMVWLEDGLVNKCLQKSEIKGDEGKLEKLAATEMTGASGLQPSSASGISLLEPASCAIWQNDVMKSLFNISYNAGVLLSRQYLELTQHTQIRKIVQFKGLVYALSSMAACQIQSTDLLCQLSILERVYIHTSKQHNCFYFMTPFKKTYRSMGQMFNNINVPIKIPTLHLKCTKINNSLSIKLVMRSNFFYLKTNKSYLHLNPM